MHYSNRTYANSFQLDRRNPGSVRRQRGEIPVGNLLVIGLIVVPLILGLIVFRVQVFTFLIDRWVDLCDTVKLCS